MQGWRKNYFLGGFYLKKIFIFICLFFAFSSSIYASETLVKERIDDTYAYYYDSNLGRDRFLYASIYRFGDHVSYCLELGKDITSEIYNVSENFDNFNISDETKEKIKLISYYGYDYEGHDTINYYLATQELIWRELTTSSVKWVRNLNSNDEINVDFEKGEITRLIERHFIKPSFSGDYFTINSGEEKVLIDENNILSEYYTTNSNVVIDGNKLIIDSNFKEEEIELIRRSYTDKVFLLYTANLSQTMMSSGKVKVSHEKVYVNLRGAIEIFKYGEDILYADDGFKYTNVLLSDVLFDIYADDDIYENGKLIYKKDEMVGQIVTDSNGYGKLDNLPIGNYYLIEVKSNLGNVIDDSKHFAKVDFDNMIVTIKANNYLPKGKLIINKFDSSSGTPISNTLFEIYTTEGKLVFSSYTSENGQIIIDDLLYQDYYISEKAASLGYKLLDENIYFTMNNEFLNIDISNDRIKVPSTSVSKYSLSKIFCIVSGVMGLLFFVYGKKKEKEI